MAPVPFPPKPGHGSVKHNLLIVMKNAASLVALVSVLAGCGGWEGGKTPGVQTVLHIKDGLPKMKDLPKEMGGSGELLPE